MFVKCFCLSPSKKVAGPIYANCVRSCLCFPSSNRPTHCFIENLQFRKVNFIQNKETDVFEEKKI